MYKKDTTYNVTQLHSVNYSQHKTKEFEGNITNNIGKRFIKHQVYNLKSLMYEIYSLMLQNVRLW